MNREEQQRLNQKHFTMPVTGDYWQEMFCPYFIVLEVDYVKNEYIICAERVDVDREHWTFDLERALKVPHSYFNMLFYNNDATRGFVADVVPHVNWGFVVEWVAAGKPFTVWQPPRNERPAYWTATAESTLWGVTPGTVVYKERLVQETPECNWTATYGE